MDDSASGAAEVHQQAGTVEERRIAVLVLTELARAAKVATGTLAVLAVAVWVFSGVNPSGNFTGPYEFPWRLLLALLPMMLFWLTLQGSSERLARENDDLAVQGETGTS